MIKSISYDQNEILKWITDLYLDGKEFYIDPCYSKGEFYKNKDSKIKEPVYKFDTVPQYDDVNLLDCRDLDKFCNGSADSIIFDPPFLATTGQSLLEEDNNNHMLKRFGYYSNEKELHQFYIDSINTFYNVLSDNGILVFKCQDKVSSGKQYFTHDFIYNNAIKCGFYAEDLFILLAKNRLVADWQIKNQKHARKFHCYFWVFRKCDRRIQYV